MFRMMGLLGSDPTRGSAGKCILYCIHFVRIKDEEAKKAW